MQFDKDGAGSVTAADESHRYLCGPAVDQVLADEQVVNPQTPGNVVWPLADNLGTVRDLAVNDPQTGVTSVANHRVFDSFGNLKSQTNAAVDCLFGFTGLPFDKASETYRTRTRPYDPSTGRWLQPDWITFRGGDANLYRYCGNSPTNATDPSGTDDTLPRFPLSPRSDAYLSAAWQQLQNLSIPYGEKVVRYYTLYASLHGNTSEFNSGIATRLSGRNGDHAKVQAGSGW